MKITEISKKVGDSYYILDSEQFKRNFLELKAEFSKIYPKFNIAYSYKTNYIPKLCKVVDECGGLAEVVSDMELEIAIRIGVKPQNIIWNGPYKNYKKVEELLLSGGTVNLDSEYEIDLIKKIAEENPKTTLNLGIRCNFDINDGVLSRFGFDIASNGFKRAISLFDDFKNIHFNSLQCHFATRRLDTWRPRAEGMLKLIDELGIIPDRIDLGGGIFGKMHESLMAQFDSDIPTYKEYAEATAILFKEHFENAEKQPELLIEPGSALVGDCMKFAAKVVNIKEVRGKKIATLLGSIYNINPTLNKKNPPIEVYSVGNEQRDYEDLDFGGFTCIESDYLYRHYNGKLAVGDTVVFGNAGSYSVVLKPPFILPNFPVIEVCGEKIEIIKKAECFDDIFHTYEF